MDETLLSWDWLVAYLTVAIARHVYGVCTLDALPIDCLHLIMPTLATSILGFPHKFIKAFGFIIFIEFRLFVFDILIECICITHIANVSYLRLIKLAIILVTRISILVINNKTVHIDIRNLTYG